MANELAPSNLQKIQNTLLGPGAVKIFKDALPAELGAHAEQAALRFAKMVYTAVTQSADLQKCSPESIAKAASISASLNLDIDPRGLAYLVPFKQQAVFIIGYQGLMELAYRSGKVKSFSATLIYESENDKITITRENGEFTIHHPYSWEKPTGPIIGAYSTVVLEDGRIQQYPMRIDEIEFFHQKSPAPNSPAWKNYYESMCKKTVIRQHCKWLPKAVTKDLELAVAREEQQTTFVESREIAAKQIEENAGSVMADKVFGEPEPTQQAPDFMKDC